MKFCDLDYAECIHWTKDPMHTVTNIISNSIHVFNKEKNRTERPNVREECKKQQIHEHLWRGTLHGEYTTAKWIFEKEHIEQIHNDMKKLKVGSGFLELMKKGGGEYSSDKIEFATQHARKVIKIEYGDPKVTENTLQLFDFIKYLFQKEFQEDEIDKNINKLYSILSDREGFLPISECTYALHEIIHISHQIKITGPPLLCNMFKFERQNKTLKSKIQNTSQPISSIVQSYSNSELSAVGFEDSPNGYEIIKEVTQSFDQKVHTNIPTLLKALNKIKLNSETKEISCYDNFTNNCMVDDLNMNLQLTESTTDISVKFKKKRKTL